jgi:hypothetical protein
MMGGGAGDGDRGIGPGRRGRADGGEMDELVLTGASAHDGRVALARTLDHDLFGPPHAGLVAEQGGTFHHHPQALEALGDDIVGDELLGHAPPPGCPAGARR